MASLRCAGWDSGDDSFVVAVLMEGGEGRRSVGQHTIPLVTRFARQGASCSQLESAAARCACAVVVVVVGALVHHRSNTYFVMPAALQSGWCTPAPLG